MRGDAFVVLRQLDVEQAGVADLQQHAELISKIEQPNLARVYACDSSEAGTYWVSELVAGATLHELRLTCKKAGKSFPLGLAFAAIHETALALGELHAQRRGHGDVRSENVIVGFNGVAKVINPGVLDSVQRLQPDPQTDVFKLAGMLYECLTGGMPAGPAFAPPSSFNHSLEKPVDDLLLRALGTDRTRRFKNATEFARELKAAAGAYMWKVAQRADFVTTNFKARRAKEQSLLAAAPARLGELRSAREAARIAAEEEAAKAKFLADSEANAALAVFDEPVAPASDEPSLLKPLPVAAAPAVYSVPRRALMLGAAAIAGITACVFLVGALSANPAVASAAVLAPPIPVMVPVAPPPPAEAAPAPAPAPEQLADATAAAPAAAAEEAPAEEVKPKPKPKKKKNEAPLPPWLMKK